jgi:Protein CHAPERONE-LIKE PROTEIN OF POR1-like
MNHGSESPELPPAGEPIDPYSRLGIAPDASFDAVQAAKQARLEEVGEDPLARSRIEAAYDAVLMDRLKERQQGRVSSAARTASQREQASRTPLPALPSLPQLPTMKLAPALPSLPSFSLAQGRDRWFPLGAHGALLVLLLLPGVAAELPLSLGALVTVISLQRRHGRLGQAVLWSLGLLIVGLLVGALLVSLLDPALPLGLPITALQAQSLPAILLLLLGALLIG